MDIEAFAWMRRLACAGSVTLIAALSAGALPASAGGLERPQGAPILTVEGNISIKNDGDGAVFDRDMLESLGEVSFKTMTPWFTGEVEFEGVPMEKLMEAVGAKGTEVEVVALNDYKASVPIGDFGEYGVILALKRDGKYMPISDKGPLFIVYPYDGHAELQKQKFYARSVWQVAKMIVK